jgi:hypothetical protein
MLPKKHQSLDQIIYRNRLVYLLVFVLLLIASLPLDEILYEFGIILDIVWTAILIAAISAISQKRHYTVVGTLTAIPVVVSIWTRYFYKSHWLMLVGAICGFAFFVFMIIIILSFIFNQKKVTGDLIAGAAVVYLFMATAWTNIYRLIETIQPGSFAIAQTQSLTANSPFLYFSFVTITTLGYGDIFPVTTAAKSCAILEAVVGQLYLVITVAWLVGVHVSQSFSTQADRQ